MRLRLIPAVIGITVFFWRQRCRCRPAHNSSRRPTRRGQCGSSSASGPVPGADIATRIIADRLSQTWNKPVHVVINQAPAAR